MHEQFHLPLFLPNVLCYTQTRLYNSKVVKNGMDAVLNRRIAAVKMADAINAIEGVPVSRYAMQLSASWARGELTGEQMKAALRDYHKSIAERSVSDDSKS